MQDVIDADDAQLVDVDVPEWGGSVRLAPLTSKETDELELAFTDDKQKKILMRNGGIKANAVAQALRNPDGSRMFDKPLDGAMKLSRKSSSALMRLWKRLTEISGMDRNLEDVEGNFSEGPAEENG
jgi:hypothetical protein